MSNAFERLFLAGHRGMVGAAIARRMTAEGLPPPLVAEHGRLDLRDQDATRRFVAENQPTAVVVAAAKVGGIEANRTQPAAFLYDNLLIAANVIEAARQAGVPRLLFLGSTCIYPRLAPQPIPEEALLSGPLEPTNEGYAIAKIAGLKLCQMYRRQYGLRYHSAMPTNLYGPGDNYDLAGSHVLPALIRKFDDAACAQAPTVTLWGTGAPLREFLHVDDLAAAVLFLLRRDDPPDWVNVGTGEEVSIRALAELVREAAGARCEMVFDPAKPDGTPRKLCDTSRIRALGWRPAISLREGIRATVAAYRQEKAAGRLRGA